MNNFFIALGRGIGRLFGAVWNGIINLVASLIEATFRGIVQTASAFVSSRFGQGALVFGAGWWLYANNPASEAGPLLGLVGILIAFWSLRPKKSKK